MHAHHSCLDLLRKGQRWHLAIHARVGHTEVDTTMSLLTPSIQENFAGLVSPEHRPGTGVLSRLKRKCGGSAM